jgi:coproporphyrinogen III oxidase-like Fe-S oxidoreductase
MLPDNDARCFDRFVEFERDGLVLINEHRITVTPSGRFFLRNLSMAMNPDGAEHAAPQSFSFSRFA